MFKVNNRNTRTKCEICSKLIIKTTERCQWRRSGVFIVDFEHILHLALVFLLLTLSRWMPAGMWRTLCLISIKTEEAGLLYSSPIKLFKINIASRRLSAAVLLVYVAFFGHVFKYCLVIGSCNSLSTKKKFSIKDFFSKCDQIHSF